ncbi:unnamed protein product [Diplocarpon coronariae]
MTAPQITDILWGSSPGRKEYSRQRNHGCPAKIEQTVLPSRESTPLVPTVGGSLKASSTASHDDERDGATDDAQPSSVSAGRTAPFPGRLLDRPTTGLSRSVASVGTRPLDHEPSKDGQRGGRSVSQ